MSLILPEIPAVIPVLPMVIDDVHALARDKDMDSAKLSALVQKSEPFLMRPIHARDTPLIRKDAQGNLSYYMLWAHPVREHMRNPDFMVGIEFRMRKNNAGKNAYVPETILRGPLANVVIVGGMACCGALQAHWTHRNDDGSYVDRAMAPAIGLIDAEHLHWMKGKVYAAETQHSKAQLSHLCLDILANRFPDEFKHECASQAAYGDMKSGLRPAVS